MGHPRDNGTLLSVVSRLSFCGGTTTGTNVPNVPNVQPSRSVVSHLSQAKSRAPQKLLSYKEKLTTARRTTKLALATTGSRSLPRRPIWSDTDKTDKVRLCPRSNSGQTRTGWLRARQRRESEALGGRPKVYAQSRTRCAPKRECRDTPCPAQLMSVEVTFHVSRIRLPGCDKGALSGELRSSTCGPQPLYRCSHSRI